MLLACRFLIQKVIWFEQMAAFEKENRSIFLILLACAVVFWAAFYPGFMSYDSISQYGMSKSLHFNDWHPPIMSWVWSILGFFFPGPSGMLAFHISILWMSVYIWWSSFRDKKLSWLIIIVPFFPWIINFSGVLWKDVGLAFSLFALSGLALRSPTSGKIFIAFILVFYAINLRHNAIAAVLPLLFLLSYRWLKKPSLVKAFFVSFGLISLCLLLGGVLNYKILLSEKTKPSNYMMIDDLVYFSIKDNKSFLPGMNIDEIKKCGTFDSGQNKLVGKVFCLSSQPSYVKASPLTADLKGIWIGRIIQSPIDYLQFRLAAFSYLLRTPSDSPYYIWHPGIDENSYDIKMVPNGLTLAIERFVKASASAFPFFFKPYWWILSTLLLFSLTLILVKNSTVSIAQFLLISSALYIMGYVPLTPMADFRYVYWSVFATTISFVVLFIDWPGFQPNITRNRAIIVSIIAVISCVTILNLGNVAKINMEKVLYNSLNGQKIDLGDPVVRNDLVKDANAYDINGADPYLIYDVSALDLTAKNTQWLKFDFSCVGSRAEPELQLFWWGDHQTEALETQSTSHRLMDGVNLVSIQNYLKSSELARLKGVRLDLANPLACKKIRLERVEIIGPDSYGNDGGR